MRRISTLVLFFILLLIASSCYTKTISWHTPKSSNKTHVRMAYVVIDDNFSPEEKNAMASGIDLWQYSANGMLNWQELSYDWNTIQNSAGKLDDLGRCVEFVVIQFTTSLDNRIINMDKNSNSKTIALTTRRECSVTTMWLVLDRLNSLEDFKLITAHEFGHALGIDHVSDRSAIMYPAYLPEQNGGCLTKSDMNEFCVISGCNINDVTYCIVNQN